MKSMKRLLAVTLAAALFFGGADFGVFDFSPLIAKASESATDVYKAVSDYQKICNEYDSVKTSLGDAARPSNTNNCSTLEFNDDNTNGAAPGANVFGTVQSFQQTGIDAAAQIKSGGYLNATDYSAQDGTPTTEDLFITAGGSQWIVNVNYRWLHTDYVRRYTFNAYGDNYRYISVGEVNHGSRDHSSFEDNSVLLNSPAMISYTMDQATPMDAHSDPTLDISITAALQAEGASSDYTAYDYEVNTSSLGDWVGGERHGNYALTYFMTGDGRDYIATNSGSQVVTGTNALTWAGVDISATRHVDSSSELATISVQPAVAECVMYKKQLLDILKDLNETFNQLDDNYRADQGSYNIHNDDMIYDLVGDHGFVDPSVYELWTRQDVSSWMFTYESMLRKSPVNYNYGDGADSWDGGAVAVNPMSGTSSYRAMHPVCVSYWMDYAGIYATNAGANTLSNTWSHFMTPYTLETVSDTNSDDVFKQSVLGDIQHSGDNTSLSPIAFDVNHGDFATVHYLSLDTDFVTLGETPTAEYPFSYQWQFYRDLSSIHAVTYPSASIKNGTPESSFDSPLYKLYNYLNNEMPDSFFSQLKLNTFDWDKMAAFTAPYYVECGGDNPTYNQAATEGLAGTNHVSNDNINSSVNIKLNSVDGKLYVYTLQGLSSSIAGNTVNGQYSDVLALYYRNLYTVYLLVAPFLVQQDFVDYPFLSEIPGATPPTSDTFAQKNAAYYFGQLENNNPDNDVFQDDTCASPELPEALQFNFIFAAFPMGGDLDGSMENTISSVGFHQMSVTKYDVQSLSTTAIPVLTEHGCQDISCIEDVFAETNKTTLTALGNMSIASFLPEARYLLNWCFYHSPLVYTEYNYGIAYTVTRLSSIYDKESWDSSHQSYNYKQVGDRDSSGAVTNGIIDQHHYYPNNTDPGAEWFRATNDALWDVCSGADVHDGIWVRENRCPDINCSNGDRNVYHDLIQCPVCTDDTLHLGRVYCPTCNSNGNGHTENGVYCRQWDFARNGNFPCGGHATGCEEVPNECDGTCPPGCLGDHGTHMEHGDNCHEGAPRYTCTFPGCSEDSLSETTKHWHKCTTCDGTGYILCYNCWENITGSVAANATNMHNNTPVCHCLHGASGYVSGCDGYDATSRGAHAPRNYNQHVHWVPQYFTDPNDGTSAHITGGGYPASQSWLSYSKVYGRLLHLDNGNKGYNSQRYNAQNGTSTDVPTTAITSPGLESSSTYMVSERYDIYYSTYRSLDTAIDITTAWSTCRSSSMWDNDTKTMSRNYGITQRFNNVRWLDITSYTIWSMNSSETTGLTAILAMPVNPGLVQSDNIVSRLGIVVYDVDDDYNAGQNGVIIESGGLVHEAGKNYVTNLQAYGSNDGSYDFNACLDPVGNKGLGRVSNSWYPLSRGNVVENTTEYLVENYSKYATSYDNSPFDLTIGLAESAKEVFQYYNKNADVPDFMASLTRGGYAVNRRLYAFTVTSYRDPNNLTLTYNSNTQGGRSSTTFDGFVSQALANTLFTKSNARFNASQAGRGDREGTILAFTYCDATYGSRYADTVDPEIVDPSTVDPGTISDADLVGSPYHFTVYLNAGYTDSWMSNSFMSSIYCTPYSNSLLIQGDYIAVQNADGSFTTIVGQMHDTWEDRDTEVTLNSFTTTYGSDTSYNMVVDETLNGGQFSLASHNAIGNRYLSSHGWIKAQYTEILSRVDSTTLWIHVWGYYNGAKTWPYGDDVNNCTFIHTFCTAINDLRDSTFDSPTVNNTYPNLYFYENQDGTTRQRANFKDIGDVNCRRGFVNIQGDMKTASAHTGTRVEMVVDDHSFSGHALIGNKSYTAGPLAPRIPAAKGVYFDDCVTDSPSTSREAIAPEDLPNAEEISYDVLRNNALFVIDCAGTSYNNSSSNSSYVNVFEVETNRTNYANIGRGHDLRATPELDVASKQLSYVGYGADSTHGIGTKDIVLSPTSSDEQLGYLLHDGSTFQPMNTFVASYTRYRNRTTTEVASNHSFDVGESDFQLGVGSLSGYRASGSEYEKSFEQFNSKVIDVPYYDPAEINRDTTEVVGGQAAYGTDVTSNTTAPSTFSAQYPHVQRLNLKRSLPNGVYDTGDTDVVYTVAWTNESSDDELRVHAGYTPNDGGTPSSCTTNQITVYNPVATENAYVIALSDYTPDGTNNGSAASHNYLSSYELATVRSVARNTITINRCISDTLTNGNELVVQDSSYVEATSESVTTTSKRLINKSLEPTSAYTWEDYTDSYTQYDIVDLESDTVYLADCEQNVNIHVKVDTTEYYGRVHLHEGDQFYKSGQNIVILPAFNVQLLYTDIAAAYRNGTTDDPVQDTAISTPVRESGVYNISVTDLTGQAQSISMTAGSILRLSLPMANDAGSELYAQAVDVSVGSIGNVDVIYQGYDASSGTTVHTWYLVATEDATLSSIRIGGLSECQILNYNPDTYGLFVVPTLVGQVSAGSVAYIENTEELAGYESKLDGYCWVNNLTVDVQGESQIQGYVATATNFSICQRESDNYKWSLTQAAIAEPHKVENSNWRYYVIGDWKFAHGRAITLADLADLSSALYDASTWIQAPNGLYTTVGTMDQLATQKLGSSNRYVSDLVAVNLGSKVVLSLVDYAATRDAAGLFYNDVVYNAAGVMVGLGDPVPTDSLGYAYGFGGSCNGCTMTFNNISISTNHYLELSFGDSSNRFYEPLAWNILAEDLQNTAYDYVWYVYGQDIGTHSTISSDMSLNKSAYAYDVAYSLNMQHRYTELDYSWSKDWETITETKVVYNANDGTSSEHEHMLSLDDEFSIHWDNMTTLLPDTSLTTDNPSWNARSSIARGWNNVDDCLQDVSLDTTALRQYMQDEYHTTGMTDTTKWIYRKYIVFSVDMYAFTEGNSFTLQSIDDCRSSSITWDQQFDPTTPAYNDSGVPNNIVYIPAGTEVPLGYYETDSDQWDNNGRFKDYGFRKGSAAYRNGDYYTYYFWVPLAVGESFDEVSISYFVESINGVYNSGSDDGVGAITSMDYVQKAGGEDYVHVVNTTDDVQPYDLMRTLWSCITANEDDWGEIVWYADGATVLNNQSIINNLGVAQYCGPTNRITNHVAAGGSSIAPFNESTTTSVDAGLRYGSAFKTDSMSIVGRVGGLTVVDSGDPRWQDTYKVGNASEYAVSPIVHAVTRYVNKSSIETGHEEGSQNIFMQDPVDVRGRYVFNDNGPDYELYTTAALLRDTYGTQTFKDSSDATANELPVATSQNIHSDALTIQGTTLGYELMCSLDTIGNYFGTSAQRNVAGELPSNNNGDYGQTKIQVRPVYFGYDADTGAWEAVDMYMRRGSNYTLINAGSPYYSADQVDTTDYGSGSYLSQAPYYMDAINVADYSMSIPTNTYTVDSNGDRVIDAQDHANKLGLDSALMRRMVTNNESNATLRVLSRTTENPNLNVMKAFINRYSFGDSSVIGGMSLDTVYEYGNAQMFYLRDAQRDFVGGPSTALGGKDAAFLDAAIDDDVIDMAEQYAQKWYFGYQVPSSAVFVKHGGEVTAETISKYEYVLCTFDIYAIGEKWVLHYESPLAESKISIDGSDFDWTQWNVIRETNPWLLPVTYYDLKTNAGADYDTRGAY